MLLSDGKDRPNVRQKERINLGRRGCAEQLQWALFTGAQEEKLTGVVNHRLVQRLNSRRRQVLELQRDLLAMVQARSAEPLVGQDAEGRVSGVQSYGFFVEVGETRVEGLVHVSSLNDDWYEYRSRQNRLVGRKNRRVYQLGDEVRVRVVKVDVLRNQIDLEVIPEATTDEDGQFSLEALDPGLVRVHLIAERDGHRDVYANRVLLSPPALIEPIGFTTLDFTFPSSAAFAAQPCEAETTDCEIRTIDRTPSQMDHPLMDPSAATGYVLVGFAFMGLAIISAGFAAWSLKAGSVALLRTSSVLAFFTMGHYYAACIFGLMAFVLTFAIPKRYIPLTGQ